MPSPHDAPRQNPDVLQQLELYVHADSPEVYKMHDFIESIIGGSATKRDFRGSLRLIADEGRLPDFALVVEKFDKLVSKVRDEDDRYIFSHLLAEARDAIKVMQQIEEYHSVPDSVSLQIANNAWNTSADLYRNMKKAS